MTVLYEDSHLICDDVSITIKNYYFPMGSKRIPYARIQDIKERELGPLTGQYRVWGMGFDPHWYHFDAQRMKKNRQIVLRLKQLIHPVLTPEDHDAVLAILRERVSA